MGCRLRLQLHDLESEQSSLISVDAVEKHLSRIQELQNQLKTKEDQLKNLIQRYSLLKNATEKAFVASNGDTPKGMLGQEEANESSSYVVYCGISSCLFGHPELGRQEDWCAGTALYMTICVCV